MRARALLSFFWASVISSHALGNDACLDAYDTSQRLRRQGELVAARQRLLECAQESCPAAVAKECTRWLREVNESLPSVVLSVRKASGEDVFDVRVRSGDTLLAERLSGRAVALDPGPHTLSFELADGRVLEKSIVVREGEKNRLVELRLAGAAKPPPPAPAPAPEAEPQAGSIPTLAIVLAGIGVLALGSFAYFAIDSKTDVDDMEGRCAPGCPQSEVDRAERKALIADISLGVGVVALGAAGFTLIASPSSDGASRGGVMLLGGRF